MSRGRRCQAIRIASPGIGVDSEAKRQIVVILSPSRPGSQEMDNHEFKHRLLESLEFLGLAIENGISNRRNEICIHRVNMPRVLDMIDRELWNRTLKSIQISSMQSKRFVRRYCWTCGTPRSDQPFGTIESSRIMSLVQQCLVIPN
jgi:hypothetical protein